MFRKTKCVLAPLLATLAAVADELRAFSVFGCQVELNFYLGGKVASCRYDARLTLDAAHFSRLSRS